MSGLWYFWGGCALHSPCIMNPFRYAERWTAWKTQISVKEWFFFYSLNLISLCKIKDCCFHELCITFHLVPGVTKFYWKTNFPIKLEAQTRGVNWQIWFALNVGKYVSFLTSNYLLPKGEMRRNLEVSKYFIQH